MNFLIQAKCKIEMIQMERDILPKLSEQRP